MEKLKNLNSGLGQFCLNLGQQFNRLHTNQVFTFYLPSHLKGLFSDAHQYKATSKLHKFLPVTSKPYDIWHALHQDAYLPSSKHTKLILTIHDLNFLEKDIHPLRKKKKIAELQSRINKAAAITTISQFTADVVQSELKLPNIPIKVIYNGNSLQPMEGVFKPAFVPDAPFIFGIGIINPKKNFHVVLPLLEQFQELHLVLAGIASHPYADQIRALAEKAGVSARLHMPGPIDEGTKYWLYQHCQAFVFPSLSEGFGLPVVEAMSLGKPVFLSNLTSLPEIGGPEAYFWQNFEPAHMCEVFEKGMQEFSSNPGLKAQRLGQWAAKFSWESAAKDYLELYNAL